MESASPSTFTTGPATTGTRAGQLRQRCLQRKRCLELPSYIHLAKAASFAQTREQPWLNLRFGQKVKDVLGSLPFVLDDLELLAGRLRPQTAQDVAEEMKKADAILAHFPQASGITGHTALDYGKLFRLGVAGLQAEVTARLAALDEADPEQQQQRIFHRSVRLALEGFTAMIRNTAAAARTALNGTAAPARRQELELLAGVCERSATEPPATFYEAIQLLWFAILAAHAGDEAWLIVPGRLDRTLWPFYAADLERGRLTRDQALELLECLYILINETIADGLAMSVMVGGRDAQGHDVTNELSFLSLEALRRTKLVYPTVGVCWHPGTPQPLVALAAELIAKGYSTPAFFGDEVIQCGLRNLGASPEDACNYINSTCVEITVIAASNIWVASPYFNLTGALLETLDRQLQDGRVPATFDEFLAGYYQTMAGKIRAAVIEQNGYRETRFRFCARPFQSALTGDCLARGTDIEQGGARYNWVECSFVGMANLADSLIVLREEVFGASPRMSLKELREIIATDFAGHEEIRQRFLNKYPKYGNAEADVDSLVRGVFAFLVGECRKYRIRPNAPFVPGAFCWIMHEALGRNTGATPDGRHRGFPFADGSGPAQGREKKGPTGAILSVTSWDASPLIGGSAFNMKFNAALFDTPEKVRRLEELVVTFLRRGGFETQINVLNPDDLRKAREHPEAYADLVVRIGGYTDYFVRLLPGMQDEIIARTAYDEV